MKSCEEIYRELFAGVEAYSLAGNEKNKQALLNAITKEGQSKKIFLKMMIRQIINFHSVRRHKHKILIGLGWENIELISFLAQNYDLCILNPSRRLLRFCYKTGNEVIFSSNSLREALYDLYENRNMGRLLQEMRQIDSEIEEAKFVLFPDDLEPLLRIYLYRAKEQKMKTATIQHGYFSEKEKNIGLGKYSDYLLVWGGYYKRILYEEEPDTKIIRLGYPYPVTGRDLCGGFAGSKILFIGQPRQGKELEEIVKVLYSYCEKHNLALVYRPHPAENVTDLKQMFNNLEKMTYSTSELIDDISDAKVVVSISSTVILQSLLYKKCVIQIRTSNSFYDFSDAGNVICIDHSPDQIREALEFALNNQITGELNPEYLYVNNNYHSDLKNIIDQSIGKKTDFYTDI